MSPAVELPFAAGAAADCSCGRGPAIGILHYTATRMWFRALGTPLDNHPDFAPDAACLDCVADTAARIATGEAREEIRSEGSEVRRDRRE